MARQDGNAGWMLGSESTSVDERRKQLKEAIEDMHKCWDRNQSVLDPLIMRCREILNACDDVEIKAMYNVLMGINRALYEGVEGLNSLSPSKN